MNEEFTGLFTTVPIVFPRISRKLSRYFVKAKLYPLKIPVGSTKCNIAPFHTCSNVNETVTFISTVTGQTYRTSHEVSFGKQMLDLSISLPVTSVTDIK